MTVKKLTVENLRMMVKEAVAQERKAKIEADKKKAEKEKVNESKKTIKVTLGQLRHLVNEAVRAKLNENFSSEPQIGDMVSLNGKTGYVADIKMGPEGPTVGITNDGVQMKWVPAAAVQVMATSDELDELSPEEMLSIDSEMGIGSRRDPGEHPDSELERLDGQLGQKLLAKPTRAALSKRQGDLKAQLGITDDVY